MISVNKVEGGVSQTNDIRYKETRKYWRFLTFWFFTVISITVVNGRKEELLLVCVVVQFYPWFKFSFLFFFVMVMYDNNMIMSLKQKKRKFEPSIKLNHNMCIHLPLSRSIERTVKVTVENFSKPPCYDVTVLFSTSIS